MLLTPGDVNTQSVCIYSVVVIRKFYILWRLDKKTTHCDWRRIKSSRNVINFASIISVENGDGDINRLNLMQG